MTRPIRRPTSWFAWAAGALLVITAASAAEPTPKPILPGSLVWSSPSAMPELSSAWVLGSDSSPGTYVLRVRLAADARIPPHTHPDERYTIVLDGTLYVGFGTAFDPDRVVAIPKGGVYVAPANVPHFVWARDGNVEYQEAGVGPTGTQFLPNP
ncbi:MAG TPA: cupin domain-containing protein [Steroidobacteraceae bacterium]|nr:cupin domain-containing protein [Steroidobacteraceae bacterium]